VYPKARLDALSDSIFGVAMTLLVLDVRLPESFQPRDASELTHALFELWAKFLPYLLSFIVLGLRWLSNIRVRSGRETHGRSYAEWWLFYHLLITCIPLSTIVVGRFAGFAPSIWLYAGNTILIALVSFRLLALTPELERDGHLRQRRISLALLIASSLLAIAWSFVSPHQSLWALALNLASPMIDHRKGRSE
jgi:TMEM175 potassium channel family protein